MEKETIKFNWQKTKWTNIRKMTNHTILWVITVKCMVYVIVGSLYLYGGPTSVTETVRLIILLLFSYTTCCFGDF